MMIFIAWVFMIMLIGVHEHISQNELNKLDKETKEALYKRAVLEPDDVEGTYLSVATYRGVGKRQTIIGLLGIILLLYMFTEKPFYETISNAFIYVLNGICITSLIGFMFSGADMWNASIKTSSMDEEEQCKE